MKDVSFPLAFLAGVLSFLSPCVLPLVPSYVSFITGVSFEDLTARGDKKGIRFTTIASSLTFILGFSAVFIALGASSSAAGNFLFEYQEWIRIAGGILIIIFGLFVAGFLKVGFLMREKKFHLSGKPMGYVGTFFVGMTFAAGWTPCIGPILGTILLYASSKGSVIYGFKLLAVYSLGLALPFFISALVINTFLGFYRRLSRFMEVICLESGLLLIAVGIILLTNYLRTLSAMVTEKYPSLSNIEGTLAQYPHALQLILAFVLTAVIAVVLMLCFTLIGFWLWAILDCKRREFRESSEKMGWLAVTVLGFIPGAVLYLIVMSRKSNKT